MVYRILPVAMISSDSEGHKMSQNRGG